MKTVWFLKKFEHNRPIYIFKDHNQNTVREEITIVYLDIEHIIRSKENLKHFEKWK